jgi:hypothetical protein
MRTTTRSGLPKRAVVEDVPKNFYEHGKAVDASTQTPLEQVEHMIGLAAATGNRVFLEAVAAGKHPEEIGKLIIEHVLTGEQRAVVAELFQRTAASAAGYLSTMNQSRTLPARTGMSERARTSTIRSAAGAVQRARAAARTVPPTWPPERPELQQGETDDRTIVLSSSVPPEPSAHDVSETERTVVLPLARPAQPGVSEAGEANSERTQLIPQVPASLPPANPIEDTQIIS